MANLACLSLLGSIRVQVFDLACIGSRVFIELFFLKYAKYLHIFVNKTEGCDYIKERKPSPLLSRAKQEKDNNT